ncbi:hypothetical protein BC939DRAFT_497686 [Gamsiella multidivaricata]|uniref:uncharacterized protein n=1 Tax=Gamsiella multidivaricata TaxID=101098 RepID=UPI00221F5310|nr:uncharacterized protein BC939DRAFT_497686 [Gamsiella multidivaricata]KAI7816072.1 hypothetical protein BC939DRAFT_497686 [Gamsiella multidivaricata]
MAEQQHPEERPAVRQERTSRVYEIGKSGMASARQLGDPSSSLSGTVDMERAALPHTIDLDTHFRVLHHLGQGVIEKYGHHIRVVVNLKDQMDADIMSWSQASKLVHLDMCILASLDLHARFYDIVRRNSTNLVSLHFACMQEPKPFLRVDALSTGTTAISKLSFLRIERFQMTRGEFTVLLKMCPLLDTLDMREVPIKGDIVTEAFRHPRLHSLVATIAQIFEMDPTIPNTPPLVVHFPRLRTWKILDRIPAVVVPMDVIRDNIGWHCPLLRAIHTETDEKVTTNLLTRAFYGLAEIRIDFYSFSLDEIMAVRSHRSTLESVGTILPHNFSYDVANVGRTYDRLQGYNCYIQELLRCCTRLRTISFPLEGMDINEIEKAQWPCKDLEILQIRIRGLDTKETIDRTTDFWMDKRAESRRPSSRKKEATLKHGSIEERVARHLLQFDSLKEVWLGHKIRRL